MHWVSNGCHILTFWNRQNRNLTALTFFSDSNYCSRNTERTLGPQSSICALERIEDSFLMWILALLPCLTSQFLSWGHGRIGSSSWARVRGSYTTSADGKPCRSTLTGPKQYLPIRTYTHIFLNSPMPKICQRISCQGPPQGCWVQPVFQSDGRVVVPACLPGWEAWLEIMNSVALGLFSGLWFTHPQNEDNHIANPRWLL